MQSRWLYASVFLPKSYRRFDLVVPLFGNYIYTRAQKVHPFICRSFGHESILVGWTILVPSKKSPAPLKGCPFVLMSLHFVHWSSWYPVFEPFWILSDNPYTQHPLFSGSRIKCLALERGDLHGTWLVFVFFLCVHTCW